MELITSLFHTISTNKERNKELLHALENSKNSIKYHACISTNELYDHLCLKSVKKDKTCPITIIRVL